MLLPKLNRLRVFWITDYSNVSNAFLKSGNNNIPSLQFKQRKRKQGRLTTSGFVEYILCWNRTREHSMVGVRFSSQLYQQFSNRAMSPRDVCHESVRKKRRLNDDIQTPELSHHHHLSLDINKKSHPVKGAELFVAWSGDNIQAIQYDHSYCFVAENDETDLASISNLKDTKPKQVNSVSSQTDITMCCNIRALRAAKNLESYPGRQIKIEKRVLLGGCLEK